MAAEPCKPRDFVNLIVGLRREKNTRGDRDRSRDAQAAVTATLKGTPECFRSNRAPAPRAIISRSRKALAHSAHYRRACR
jgi:hypothetical protein